MEYSAAELTQAVGLSIDTIRYYQSLGILQSPERRGRNAVYGEAHLERLRVIRSMADRGLSLKVIATVLERDGKDDSDRALLAALQEESAEPRLSSAELSLRLGIPRSLLRSIEKTGLAEAQEGEDGEGLYSESDLNAARGALKFLDYGFPLTKLLSLAVKHYRATKRTVDEAIDLFDDYVRKKGGEGGEEEDPEAVARVFKEMLPLVTMLIAHHFERVLVNRALKRLKKQGRKGPLELALKVARRNRVGLRWR